MTVYRRSGAKSWSVLVEIGRDANGRRRRIYEGGFRTKREAQAKELEVKTELANGSRVDHSNMTVAEYMRIWLRQHSHDLKPTTVQSYAANVKNHVIPHLGQIRLQELIRRPVERFLRLPPHRRTHQVGLIKAGHSRGRRSATSPPSSGRHSKTRWIRTRCPQHRNRSPQATRESREREPDHNLDRTRNSPIPRVHRRRPAPRPRVVHATTGLRRGEALGLRWEDIDLPQAQASIRQNLVVVEEACRSELRRVDGADRSPLRTNRRRTTAWRAHQMSEKLALGAAWVVPGHSLHPRGRLATSSGPSHRRFPTQPKEPRLPRLTLHQLRHTWATLALGAGVQPKIVSENLGHSSTRITMDVYSHALPTMTATPSAKWRTLSTDMIPSGNPSGPAKNTTRPELGYAAAISVEPIWSLLHRHGIYPGTNADFLRATLRQRSSSRTKTARLRRLSKVFAETPAANSGKSTVAPTTWH